MSDYRRTQITSAALGPALALTRVDTSSCKLLVENTVSKGASFILRRGAEALIGAADESQLQILDPTVSGSHARLSHTKDGIRVVDMGSTNGTYYQRSKVTEVVVPFGATISVGKAKVRIVPDEQAVEAKPSDADNFGALVGKDRRMRQMFSLLGDVAPTDATVVIEGETGTGKELVASALHAHSRRAGKPFVVFDCSSVPRELVESALFGHMKGAFTGATQNRQGAFRRAHGGTIFLDEIGELPLDLQPKLLRALESRTVQMVGGDSYERVDVRVLAATNRNLKEEVRAGRFREDLYYRLAVVRIVLPPLRDRPDDLPVLVERFLASDLNIDGPAPKVDPECYKRLAAYDWPGNVRELKNLVERARSLFRGEGPLDLARYLPSAEGALDGLGLERQAVTTTAAASLLSEGEYADVEAAVRQALNPDSGLSFKAAKAVLVDAFERHFLKDLLKRHNGNISRAAQAAKMDRKHLRELLKKNGLWDG